MICISGKNEYSTIKYLNDRRFLFLNLFSIHEMIKKEIPQIENIIIDVSYNDEKYYPVILLEFRKGTDITDDFYKRINRVRENVSETDWIVKIS